MEYMEISKQTQIRNKDMNRERESRGTWMTGKQGREGDGGWEWGDRQRTEAPEGWGKGTHESKV